MATHLVQFYHAAVKTHMGNSVLETEAARERVLRVADAITATLYRLANPSVFVYPFTDCLILLVGESAQVCYWDIEDSDAVLSSVSTEDHQQSGYGLNEHLSAYPRT